MSNGAQVTQERGSKYPIFELSDPKGNSGPEDSNIGYLDPLGQLDEVEH